MREASQEAAQVSYVLCAYDMLAVGLQTIEGYFVYNNCSSFLLILKYV